MANPTYNIPTEQTDVRSWQQWHKDLLSTGMGVDKANQVWLAYWADRGKNKDDYDLRTYMGKYGINLTSNILERASNFGHGVANVFGGIFTGAKWTVIIIGGLTVVAIGSLLFSIIRKPTESLSAAGGAFAASKGGGLK